MNPSRLLHLAAAASAVGLICAATRSAPRLDSAELPLHVPFHVGERLTFTAKVGFLNAGSADMHVVDVERLGGSIVYHTTFDIHGKVLFKSFNNHYESWFDTTSLSSLRHVQDTDQGDSAGHKEYTFDWAHRTYSHDGQTFPGVSDPVEEGSFLYFLRSLPLRVGATDTIARYYHLDRNPIVITVERREHIKVAAGEFDAFVVAPVIKSHGLFSVDSHAEVWIADTPQRTLLKLKSKLPVGTLYLELSKVEPAPR